MSPCCAQRLRQIDLAERRADLAEIGAVGAHQRRLAPVEPALDDQPVEQVVAGVAAPDREEAGLQPLVMRGQIDRLAVRGLQQQIVQEDR